LTDPGQGLVTGKWQQLGRFKVPGLRGQAAHPPYFHDGSATTIAEVVEYVDTRFAIELTAEEKSDLQAFLAAL
jgi:cytochrome c peroxidase